LPRPSWSSDEHGAEGTEPEKDVKTYGALKKKKRPSLKEMVQESRIRKKRPI